MFGVQGKLQSPFLFDHDPKYRNTWQFNKDYLPSLDKAKLVEVTLKKDGGAYWLDDKDEWWARRDYKPWIKKRNGKKVELTKEVFESSLELKRQKDPVMKQWIPCCEPDLKGGHWFGWVPIKADPQTYKYAWEAVNQGNFYPRELTKNMTYELLGPAMQGNPYGLKKHVLVLHGCIKLDHEVKLADLRSPDGIRRLFTDNVTILRSEGVVIYLDGKPVWKIHHGHIHDGDDQKTKAWKNNPYCPQELSLFV